MGISERMSQVAGQIQGGIKNSSKSIAAVILKVATGFVVGLTAALIGQEIFAFGTILFVFTMVVVGLLLYRVMGNWTLGAVLVFDLICVLVSLLLRMYILVAP
jgi:ABC-type uncharacterized transport system permease subunit